MNAAAGFKSSFADNQRLRVADAIRGVADYGGHRHPIAIATGYFNLGGFASVADVLEAAPAVRILIGAEPEQQTIPDMIEVERDTPEKAVSRVESAIVAGRDEIDFTPQDTAAVQRLKAFLQRPTTEVRIYREQFLHGKAFIFGSQDAVIAGSANFTAAGLNHNRELDLGQYNPDDVARVSEWFEALWSGAEPYDLAHIFNARLQEYEPHTIYLRMLYAQYSPELRADIESQALFGSLQLAEFQQIGSQRAVRILDSWNGAILADGVGLGKTVVAGDVIRTFTIERGLRVLIVCPASLREMWQRFLNAHNLPGQVISYTQLAQEAQLDGGGARVLQLPPNQYRLIVADEAHSLRNPGTAAYAAMVTLLAKSPDAKVLLLTATPVNNSLWDLYHEVMLFAKTDNAFAKVGIPNLRDHVKAATRLDPDDINPAHMFAVLDAVSVRRTRQFIKKHFANATINGQRIVFPRIEPHAETYNLDAVIPGLFEDVADAIEHRLHMARYRTHAYAHEPDQEAARQEFLSGLLRSQMLKRFESSCYAFRKTLEKMIAAHEQCLSLIEENGLVPPTSLSMENALDDEDLDTMLADGDVAPESAFDVPRLCGDLRADIAVLRELHTNIAALTADKDPKLAALRKILSEAQRSANSDKRKVLVFTGFVDTVRYIKDFLETTASNKPDLRDLVQRAAYVLGNRETDVDTRAALACGFAPRSMEPDNPAEDIYDLLVTTDVLAEGQNLQQCGRIVNFDLPWNPMRVVQRNGRVDRIGSPHDVVDMHCFMPDTQLDAILRLEERLQRKISHANAGVGVEGVIIPGIATREHVFVDAEAITNEKSEQIRRLREGDATVISELDQDDAYTGEQFREELRAALLSEAGGDLERLPWGIGSGHSEAMAASVVFLAKAGKQYFFRTVPLEDVASATISGDLLAALKTARCSYAASRLYPDEIRSAVYSGWEKVRYSIYASAQELRDPARQQVALPKAQRDAIDLLARSVNGSAPAVSEILASTWPTDVEKSLRQILRDDSWTDEQRVEGIIDYVARRGLRAPAREDTADIREGDVKLVCYQVVLPKASGDGATDYNNALVADQATHEMSRSFMQVQNIEQRLV